MADFVGLGEFPDLSGSGDLAGLVSLCDLSDCG